MRLWPILGAMFLILSTAGILLLLLFRFASPDPRLTYYQYGEPLFLPIFGLSLPLLFKAISFSPLPVRIAVLSVFGVSFLLVVPVEVTAHTQYLSHCGGYYTAQEWKSLAYSYFAVGYHLFSYRPDYACQLPF